MKRISALSLVLILALAVLAGCSKDGGGANAAPTGKYVLTSAEMDGNDMVPFFTEMGMNTDDFYIEFLSDGKFKMSVMGEEGEGTFKLDGNTLTMTVDGDDLEAKIEDNKITMEQEGDPETEGYSSTKMVFEKK